MFNKKTSFAIPSGRSLASQLLSGGFAALSLVLMLWATGAQAATPLAGTNISNTATATYVLSGTPTTATSNTVTTTVLPVGSFTLASSQNFDVAPGEVKSILHTLTNTGNDTDSFNITLPNSVSMPASSVKIIADTNNNGVLDSGENTVLCTVGGAPACTNISTGSLNPSGVYNFFVEITASTSAANNTSYSALVNATAVTTANYTTATLSNTDTINIRATIFNVAKSITTTNTGTWNSAAGTLITYKLDYQNTGSAAGPLYIEDTIGSASTVGFTYLVNSGVWSGGGTMTDTAGASDDSGVTHYEFSGGKVKVYIENVAAGGTGFITFNVKVANSSVAAGTSETTNRAYYGVPTSCTGVTCTLPGSPLVTTDSPFTVLALNAFNLLKEQALGTWNSGTSSCGAAGAYSASPQSQLPGQCIWYRVIADNSTSTSNVNTMVISDPIPANTTYAAGSANCSEGAAVIGTATASAPAGGATGTVSCATWTTIPGGSSAGTAADYKATMEFAVRINP